MKIKPFVKPAALAAILGAAGIFGYQTWNQYMNRVAVLERVIERLEADSRAAEVLVTKVQFDEKTRRNLTTIKFVEYDALGEAMPPRYFTFAGNIIQFQSLVIRFADEKVRDGEKLAGKSIYIFWKVFMLDGKDTQEYEVTPLEAVPAGYRIGSEISLYEREIWQDFWAYGLDPGKGARRGVKNAQIEAPGAMFRPGILYTIRIEHDGGLRIDQTPLPPILRGEQIPN